VNFATLLRPADLMGHLADPNWLVLDCRFELSDPGAGERAWAAGHIPGAVHAHLDRDLSGPVTASTGRHPLPDRGAFAATLSRWGIQPVTQVVAYDASSGMFAARLWWMLRWAGHDRVAVLDGGLQGWTAAGGALDRSVQQRQPVRFEPAWRDDRVVATDELAPMIGRGDCVLVDARGPDRFEGRVEPIDPVAGHVPGAVNHPCQRNLDADGRFLPPAQLLERWRDTLGGRAPASAVCMCGSGVTACHDLLALEHAGLSGARLYAGSWSEWIRDPGRPVARGGA
jgi:thiosulfate/3-mercaptopyruvate sulfurtransferase